MPRAALALLWLLGGTAFLPLVWLGLVGTGRGFDQGLWKSNDALRSAEIWSPQTGRWSRTGDLPEPFWNHEAVLLKGGDVLVLAEGQAGLKAERWSPSSGAWSPAGVATFHSQLRLIALHDGRALVTGIGAASAPGEGVELFDPAQNGWRSLPGPGHGGVICAD